jgi:hypothetical protein
MERFKRNEDIKFLRPNGIKSLIKENRISEFFSGEIEPN